MVDMGVDGVIVSSHGGKIVDRAPSPLAALPGIKAAVGDRAAVLMDGGVRRGVDVAIARCLGADFILAGRPMLYGLAAAGGPGADRAIDLLRTELDLILATVGCSKFDDLSRRNLYQPAALSEN
jgi:L-lactate dehydrogenase (cytochrome)/(S)-mandelate dehydrogenase